MTAVDNPRPRHHTASRGPLGAKLGWPAALALHLVPGAALLLFFLAAAPVLSALDLPPVWGLLLGTLAVVVPVELTLAVRGFKCSSAGRWSWSTLGLRRPRRGDLPALLLAGGACLLAPGLVVGVEPLLRQGPFGWLPPWFAAGMTGLSAYPPAVRVITVVLWLSSLVVLGPAVEEIYFRGWLLPRLSCPPVLACTANAALFAAYHLWQPHTWLTIFVFALPLTALALVRRNVTLCISVHCTVNLMMFAGLLTGMVQR